MIVSSPFLFLTVPWVGLLYVVVAFPGPEVIKLFSCSTQLSIDFAMLITTKMLKSKDFSCFQTLIMLYLSC